MSYSQSNRNHERSSELFKLGDLSGLLEPYRCEGKKIVLCHGVFDLLHIGHIRYFEQARQMGDILVVTVTPDKYVDKGPHRPAFPEKLRAEAIASLKCVDYVAINEWPTAEETLRILRPQVYVKGAEFSTIYSDRTGKISREVEVVKEIGAQLAFAKDIVFSSSNLINRYLSQLPKELDDYLKILRQRHTLEDLLGVIEKMQDLKVLVVGDTIIDEYVYTNALGKSSKDPVLALKYLSKDTFAGGVLAVANHLANFAGTVTLGTVLGDMNDCKDFVKDQLNPSINFNYFTQENAPTIIKRRFVDGYSFNKLFEVYEMDDSGLSGDRDREFNDWLKTVIPEHDLVIVADFGHGATANGTIKLLCEQAPYLAVNTQANAGNRGFNTISKYTRLDYSCIAEHEIRLETRDSKGPIRSMMEKLLKDLGGRHLVTTRGRQGCAVTRHDGEFIQVPAFASNVVDRVGAGDAFFAITSLAAFQDAPIELIGFLGNVVGSLAVEIIGNKKSVDKKKLLATLTSLMK